MVTVAQLVRAPDCGSGGWGFNSPRSPLECKGIWGSRCRGLAGTSTPQGRAPDPGPLDPGSLRSVAQLVEHRSPKPAVGGSSPSGPACEERCAERTSRCALTSESDTRIRRYRLGAQDTALSRLEHGFESRYRYWGSRWVRVLAQRGERSATNVEPNGSHGKAPSSIG
jgi:hypothetical protein